MSASSGTSCPEALLQNLFDSFSLAIHLGGGMLMRADYRIPIGAGPCAKMGDELRLMVRCYAVQKTVETNYVV